MLAIRFEFIANRYHATQWGRHVNEGVLEWPPSPWRILRAIVATWRRALPDMPAERVAPLLETLASELPSYSLPPASAGHTRHFMPKNTGNRKRDLVIDSFIAIQPEKPVYAVWRSVELDSQQIDDLSAILHSMPYLGRAESWVEAGIESNPPEPNSEPMENGALPDGDVETVRTLTPRAPIRLEDLMVETSELRRGGRIDPEGAQWWLYTRKANCFTEFRSRRASPSPRGEGAEVVRFALSSNVLPMVKDTLRWGDLARISAMSRFGRQNGGSRSPTLSGRDSETGEPLKGHKHAFYLPTDEDGDGRLDHLTLWAPGGLSAAEFRAAASMTALNPGRGRQPIQLAYQARGSAEDFAGVSPLFDETERWRSLTPYALTRHVKRRGPRGAKRIVDGPEDQIRREIGLRQNLPRLSDVRIQEDRDAPIAPMKSGQSEGIRAVEFFRYRDRGSRGGGAYSFAIEFAEPVRGPVALGFGCHYGLGLFVPG